MAAEESRRPLPLPNFRATLAGFLLIETLEHPLLS